MKTRVIKSCGESVRSAVLQYNLKQEKGDVGSGALDNLFLYNHDIQGGYRINSFGELVGWGAAFSNGEFHVYVRPFARKAGAATKVVKRAGKEWPEHNFCPWNHETRLFFIKRNANVTYEYF